MENLKEEFGDDGRLIHYAVLALIEKDGKLLLVNRKTLPSGYALVTGHVDEGENEEGALIREVKEEIGLDVLNFELAFEGLMDNSICNKRAELHKWFIYKCEVEGEIKLNETENLNYGWFSKDEIKKLRLGGFWERIFKEIGIL